MSIHNNKHECFIGRDLETEHRRKWLRELQTRPQKPGIGTRWWDFRYATKHFFSRTIHNIRALYCQRLTRQVIVEAHSFRHEHKTLCREMRRQGWIPAMKAYFTTTLASTSRRSRTA